MLSKYAVGIDLGTTNSAVAYSDGLSVQLFRIPQLTSKGIIEPLSTLPSFLYLGEKGPIVGEWAREEGSLLPTRLVQSAKSWLSNSAANRKEKILPFEADRREFSPVEASARYLAHIREEWNRKFSDSLEEQEVILTIPASFDEVGRSLTVEAAHLAGITRLTLLEEPQAAFYNWLLDHEKDLDSLQVGETILVVDVGGGTTDFSLIEVTEGRSFQRMAVGKHLLLGGDNMDSALMQATGINKHQARFAKEALLGGKERLSLWIAGKGSHVVGGGKGIELTKNEVESLLVEGFFGLYDFEEAKRLSHGAGIRQMGLPFEREPSITKHLASFLSKQKKPNYVLFNGGTMKALPFQQRIIESIERWFPNQNKIKVLNSSSLDLAVSKGAAYFGMVRTGKGIRIGGGIPRSYYLKIDESQVITLLPRGFEGGEMISEHSYSLLPNTPVSFQLYYSHTRLGDQPGALLPFLEEEMTPLPPIQTVLRFGAHNRERIPVRVKIHLTEIGTLELWLTSEKTTHKWKLEFQLDAYVKEERLGDETLESALLEKASHLLTESFAFGKPELAKKVMATLEEGIGLSRNEWPPSLLRGLFDALLNHADKRTLSPIYAARFWNLAGFFMRPGRGYPLDDFRIKQLWKILLADSKKIACEEEQLQKMIFYRRIAAGLTKGQQLHLYRELSLKKWKRRGDYAYSEQMRAFASFEWIDLPLKVRLGEELVQRITSGKGSPCDFWALGRLAARELLYANGANVISPSICEGWIDRLIKITNREIFFPLSLMARKTDCCEINLSSSTVEKVKHYLGEEAELLERPLSHTEQERRFGDHLPQGIILKY